MLRRFFGKRKASDVFQFSDPKNSACFVCCHVAKDNAPILYVAHDADGGAWQFLCGSDSHQSSDGRIISLSEAVLLDPSVNALHEMPIGVCAERESVNAEWIAYKL